MPVSPAPPCRRFCGLSVPHCLFPATACGCTPWARRRDGYLRFTRVFSPCGATRVAHITDVHLRPWRNFTARNLNQSAVGTDSPALIEALQKSGCGTDTTSHGEASHPQGKTIAARDFTGAQQRESDWLPYTLESRRDALVNLSRRWQACHAGVARYHGFVLGNGIQNQWCGCSSPCAGDDAGCGGCASPATDLDRADRNLEAITRDIAENKRFSFARRKYHPG